mgnify:CR=1 FL=1
MSCRGGIALIKKNIFSYVTSRGFFWTLALSWMMEPIIYMFVWIAVVGDGSIASLMKNDFMTYYICLIIINQLTYPTSHWTVGDNIYNGTFSHWLLRPMHPMFEAISTDLAVKVITVPFVFLFTVLIAFFLKVELAFEAQYVPLFIIALISAQVLRFMAAYTIAICALITTKISSLLSINDILIFLLAGKVVPTILLPGVIQGISKLLPYRYMLGFPIEILLGMLSRREIVNGLIMQCIYIVIICIIHQIVWKHGLKKYTAYGG